MTARLFGHPGPDADRAASVVIDQLGLEEVADRRCGTYSGGQRRRLDLGAGLVGAPRLLLLDEPTTGLDPAGRVEVWDAVRALVAAGTDVVLTTHYLDEANELADHVVVIDHGKTVASGALGDIKAGIGQDVIEVAVADPARLEQVGPVGPFRPTCPGFDHRGGKRPGGCRPGPERCGHRRGRDRPAPAHAGRGLPRRHGCRSRCREMTAQMIARPVGAPGATRASAEIARRALRKYFRTPGLFAMGLVQASLFLFCSRFVFGGAVTTGARSYVYYLVPGYVATIVLFTGGGIAVAVADDRAQGFTDRLLSLPVPRRALVIGRAIADASTNAWSICATVAFGFLFGFRLQGGVEAALAALGLCLVYGVVFTFVFMVMGLMAPNVQAAQGMSMIAFVFAFISSTYVPVDSMPGWLQAFARYQPVTPMVDAVRSALIGSSADVGLALVWSALLIGIFGPIAVLRYRYA